MTAPAGRKSRTTALGMLGACLLQGCASAPGGSAGGKPERLEKWFKRGAVGALALVAVWGLLIFAGMD